MAAGSDPFEVALRQLERRARTVAEVRRHLRGRGFAPAQIDEVIGRLARLGYLDDRAYAARYAAWSAEERPMGRRRLAQELMRRGVERATIDSVLQEAFGPEQEAGALDRALRKAARGVATPPDDKARRRVASYLLRRGFRPGLVMAAVEAWAGGRGDRRAAEGSVGEDFEE
jgi:regulatory protein